MTTIAKTYNVEPNEAQLLTLRTDYRSTVAMAWAKRNTKEIELIINQGTTKASEIMATLKADGETILMLEVGSKGKVYGNYLNRKANS